MYLLQQQLQHAGAPLVVFDIPLLYETHAEQQLDVVLVVSAPADVQQQRVLARPGMTPEKLAAILARQVGSGWFVSGTWGVGQQLAVVALLLCCRQRAQPHSVCVCPLWPTTRCRCQMRRSGGEQTM